MKTGHDVRLPNGRKLHMVELSMVELLKARQAAGPSDGPKAQAAVSLAGARMSLRQIDGKPVAYLDVAGLKWDRIFRAAETVKVLDAFSQIHDPTVDDVTAVTSASVVTTETVDEQERTKMEVTVDGRVVVLRELPFERLQQALSAGDKESVPAAASFLRDLDGLRRTIATVDGDPVAWSADWLAEWPFSPKSTTSLLTLFRDIHGLGDDARPTVVASP